MSELSARQRARIDELLDALLDLPADARAAYLASHCGNDAAVRAEVESLLRAARSAGDFLAIPARLDAQPLSEEIPAGMRIGVWRVTRRIGRGGMGVVYEAVRAEGDFAQRAAIKLLQYEAVGELQRFHVERRILARLEHPGIARLYDGGVAADGRPYMVMELIEGEPITDYCARVRATLAQRMRLYGQVCDAVAYAHRNLVVHRDLKPANILVTADGQVKLLDFGIAKLIAADDRELTRTAASPLTPTAAAPEQLLGGPVTTATDVYTLGLLLFELLTGTRPWPQAGEPIAQAMRVILEKPAPAPSAAAASFGAAPLAPRLLRGDFDAIVAKALRKEPAHRYQTVDALKQDVDRAVLGEPVAARAGARLYVFGRLLRRYRWATLAVAAVVISLATGLGAAAWQAERVLIERDAARRDAAREEAVRYQLTRLFRTAIADRGAATTTAKTMIDASAQRVLREYRDQPQLAGQIVITLADLYGALEDVAGAGSLLEGFLQEADPNADPAAIADARQKLANIELLRGHVDRAGLLLGQAEAFWARSPSRYGEERLEGLGVRARQQRTRGDLEGAIATEREAIARRIALSGRNHRETAVLYNSHAITLTAAHRLDEALDAYRETTAIYQALGLGGELDAQIVLGNTGTLELRTGHLRDAEALLTGAIQKERALAGDSAAVAAAMGYYGKLLADTDRAPLALTTLREASDIGTRYAGPSSPVTVQNRLFLGAAQLAAGDRAGARATLSADHDAALAQYGADHALTLRTELALAGVAIAEGRYEPARAQLLALLPILRQKGIQAETDLAEALQGLGEVALSEGKAQQAIAPLKEAVALRDRSGDSTWELAAARERLGEALAAGGAPGGLDLLRLAAAGLQAHLGAAHPETLRAQRAIDRFGS